MKLKKVMISSILCGLLFTIIAPVQVLAASFGFTVDKSSVNPGGAFTVSINVNGSGMFYFSAVNGTVSTASQYCDTTCSVGVTAGSSGVVTVTATPGQAGTDEEVTTFNDELVTGSQSVNVSIISQQQSTDNNEQSSQESTEQQQKQDQKETEKKSNNANLSSLSVSNGTLSPKFSASKTQYTVNLTGVVSKIKVSAKAADSKASVYGTGEQSVKAGKNTLTVSVVAENGTQKDYVITVNVDETPLVYTSYNGVKLGFVRSLDGVDKPGKSFEETTLKIDGKEVSAWKSNLMNKTIVYLQNDETKEKNYYLYNTETNTVESKVQPMALLGNNVFVMDIPENLQKREGMTFTKVTIDKYELDGWKFNDKAFENYALIYVMNEKGEMVYYQYESTENTLQLYSDAASITQEAYDTYKTDMDNKVKTYTWIMYGLGAGCAILLVACIVLALRKKKTLKYVKKEVSVKGKDAESEALRNITNEE